MSKLVGTPRRCVALLLLCAGAFAACGGRAGTGADPSAEHGGGTSGRSTNDGGSASADPTRAGGRSGGEPTDGGPMTAGGAAGMAGGSATGSAGDAGAGGISAAGGDVETAGAAGAGNSPGIPACDPPVFVDPNLEAVVRKWLAKPTGALTHEDLQSVTELDATNSNISSLSGIECLPVERVYLDRNHVTDLTPLIALKALVKTLDLSGNPLLDLSPLGKLEGLFRLELNDVPRALHAQDIAILARLPALTVLNLRSDTVDTVAPLAQVATLRTMNLYAAQLSAPESLSTLKQLSTLELSAALTDLGPVSGLTGLGYLGLESNGLTDISPLKSLVQLRTLDLSENAIVDISILAGMPLLENVSLNDNELVDLTPLGALPNLNEVQLDKNAITSLTPLADNPGVDALDFVLVNNNPIDCQKQDANLKKLRAKGVQVMSDCP